MLIEMDLLYLVEHREVKNLESAKFPKHKVKIQSPKRALFPKILKNLWTIKKKVNLNLELQAE